MLNEWMDLGTLTILSIFYLFTFARVQSNFFDKYLEEKNAAILIVFGSSLLAAGINLNHISDTSSDAMRFLISQNEWAKAIGFALLFFVGMWIFSYVLFRITFFITGFLTPESELNELRKNNIEIALVHAIIILVLSFVLAPAITRVASHFVPYPTLPF
jgi:putative Mn2+ efflux pump MntP